MCLQKRITSAAGQKFYILPNIRFQMINFAFVALNNRAPLPKRRAPKNDVDWCNRFGQKSHREPIGDKTDSCQICNLARREVSEMPPAKYKKYKYRK